MPAIVIKDYTWCQTDENIIIHVPLVGHPKNVDLFTIDNYMKASYPPFILELFLWGNVLEEKSKCTLDDEQAVFSLRKAEMGLQWPSLVIEGLDREAKRERRVRALERAQLLAEECAKARSEKRQDLQRKAVRAQIDLDTFTLNKIDTMRDNQRKEAMKDFEEWRSKAEEPIFKDIQGKVQENRKAYRPSLKWFKDDLGTVKSKEVTGGEIRNEEVKNEANSKDNNSKRLEWGQADVKELTGEEANVRRKIDDSVKAGCDKEVNEDRTIVESSDDTGVSQDPSPEVLTSCSEDSESDYENKCYSFKSGKHCLVKEMNERMLKRFYKRKTRERSRPGQEMIDKVMNGTFLKNNSIFDEPEKAIPLPRKNCTINVKFSQRAFPTPARESHHLEEQEWLEKQAEARRQTGFVAEDLTPEERDPQWLKDKGDDFFKAGNYLGAISAYTHGIKLSNKMASLYVNRSAAHYAIGNYLRCAEDCSTALELMVPQCTGNQESRARCHARRGAALCKLSSPQHGIPELEAALKLAPDNETIKRDLLAAKQYFDIKD